MRKYKINLAILMLLTLILLTACGSDQEEKADQKSSSKHFVTEDYGGQVFKIVSGSENKELEPLLEEFAKENNVKIEMDYMGSLNIMHMLESGEVPYDAVWPASSVWINMGDKNHILKHTTSISQTPVVFGIRKPLAKELGFVDKEVKIRDIISAIESEKLSFMMTSATQSNSGASAYLGFLTALSGEETLSLDDLKDPQLQEQITTLLSGVNRSSGSSNWLVDLFLKSDYDAMVNYETLIIQTNKELEDQGRDPLYMVYPADGLSISDSPLAYADHGDKNKEDISLKLQDFLLSEESQDFIEKTGRRNAYGMVDDKNKDLFKKEWGADPDKTISPIRFPQAQVIDQALALYQSSFKKPSYTVYLLDFSGSMYGKRRDEMVAALEQVLIPENAKKNLLLGTEKDRTIAIPFNDGLIEHVSAIGNGQEMARIYESIKDLEPGGGTNMFQATGAALEALKNQNLSVYTPAIVVLSDGEATDSSYYEELEKLYKQNNFDIPIFSIQFGDANKEELQKLADLSGGKVFDGREDLTASFREVKGYN